MSTDASSTFPANDFKAWAIVDTREKMYLVLRIREEGTTLITHFDKIIPEFLHQEFKEIGEHLNIFVYKPHMTLVEPDIEKNINYG